MRTNRKLIFALVWRILGFGIGMFGIFAQTFAGGGFMSHSMPVYFTVQTNVFTTALFLVLAVMSAIQLVKDKTASVPAHIIPSVQLAFTFYITITFIVYWTMLSWQVGSQQYGALAAASNYFLHGVTPVFAMLDALLFLPHGKIKRGNSVIWLTYPLLYLFFIVIRAQVGGPLYTIPFGGKLVEMYYPYFFVEPNVLGSPWLLIPVVIGLLAVFWLFAKLYIFVDSKIGEYGEKKAGLVYVRKNSI